MSPTRTLIQKKSSFFEIDTPLKDIKKIELNKPLFTNVSWKLIKTIHWLYLSWKNYGAYQE